MRPRAFILVSLLLAAAVLTGCDKCADNFVVNPFAPHTCREGPAQK